MPINYEFGTTGANQRNSKATRDVEFSKLGCTSGSLPKLSSEGYILNEPSSLPFLCRLRESERGRKIPELIDCFAVFCWG